MKITTLVFLVKDNSVFLALKKEGFGTGFLNGYGGKKKPTDKDIFDTARREFKEESTATAIDLQKIAVIDFFEGDVHIYECHVFFCSKWLGLISETKEMGIPEEFNRDNMPFGNMWHSDRVWLPLIFSGKKIHAKVVYDLGMKKLVKFEYELLKEAQ